MFSTLSLRVSGKPRIQSALAAVAFIILLGLTAPASAFEAQSAVVGHNLSLDIEAETLPLISSHSSPTVTDSCLPLLKSIRHVSPTSVTDRNQRSAGTAAALGLVFGVRFALGPVEKPRASIPAARLDVWQHEGAFAGDGYALAVSSYRRCQKEQALNALRDFRWNR